MGTIAIELLQQCKLKDKYLFADLIRNLSEEQLEGFCKEILHLRHHYDTTLGAYCTNQPAVYHLNEEYGSQSHSIFSCNIDGSNLMEVI